jgi:hypothetical protein
MRAAPKSGVRNQAPDWRIPAGYIEQKEQGAGQRRGWRKSKRGILLEKQREGKTVPQARWMRAAPKSVVRKSST